MAEEFDLQAITEGLTSDDIEVQLISIEQATVVVKLLAERAILAFAEEGSHRFFMAERLHRFGSLIVPYLEKLFDETDDSEIKTLASLVLLQLGSPLGYGWLTKTFWEDGEYTCLIAGHLTKSKVIAEVEIIRRLRQCRSDEVDLITCLLNRLEVLDYELPPDIRERFSTPDVHWVFQAIVKQWKGKKELKGKI